MNEEEEQRHRELQDVILRVASGDYAARHEVSGARDEIDATIAAVNILAEDVETAHQAQKRAEELLGDERDAYDNAPGLLCSVDANSFEVVKCNRTLADRLGLV